MYCNVVVVGIQNEVPAEVKPGFSLLQGNWFLSSFSDLARVKTPKPH